MNVSLNNIGFFLMYDITYIFIAGIYHNFFMYFPLEGHFNCSSLYFYRKHYFVHSYQYFLSITCTKSLYFFFFSLIKTERRHGRENMTLTLHVIFSEASGSNPNWHISFMGQPLLMTYLLKYFHVYLYSPLSSRDPCIPATGPENGNSPPSVL